jgi:hypothetical protein
VNGSDEKSLEASDGESDHNLLGDLFAALKAQNEV